MPSNPLPRPRVLGGGLESTTTAGARKAQSGRRWSGVQLSSWEAGVRGGNALFIMASLSGRERFAINCRLQR